MYEVIWQGRGRPGSTNQIKASIIQSAIQNIDICLFDKHRRLIAIVFYLFCSKMYLLENTVYNYH